MEFGKFFGRIFKQQAAVGDYMHNNPDFPSHVAGQVRLAQGRAPVDLRREAMMYLQLTNGTL